jgi:predicted HAD superfamily Cof-like phosphohydrolase
MSEENFMYGEVNKSEEDTLGATLRFFQMAYPISTDKNRTTQMGVHFEEVAEMLDEITGRDPDAADLLAKAHEAMHNLAVHAKTQGGFLVSDRVGFIDALADQIVTAVGCAYHHRMDPIGALQEVNRSNFSKFDENGQPIFDENGKVTKGPNYTKAELSSFV